MSTRSRLLTAALALIAGLALSAAPATATVIHKELGSFTASEAPGGSFGALLPSDAVDQSTGDVYVLESAAFGGEKNVIDRFNQAGEYAELQLTGSKIKEHETFAFGASSGVAVDNSEGVAKGDVYVADTGNGAIERFSAAGKFLCQITDKKPVTEAQIKHECNGAAGSLTPECEAEPIGCAPAPAGVAVAQSDGDVYVADNAHAVIDEFSAEGKYIGQIKDPHLSAAMGAIALDSERNLYVTDLHLLGASVGEVVKFAADGSFSSVLDTEQPDGQEPTSVGVDPATGHPYVFEFLGGEPERDKIAEYEASGALVSAIAAPNRIGLGLAVNGASGRLYVSEVGTGEVSIYSGDIVTPTVSALPATKVSETAATLNGHVDPDAAHGGGEVSACEFEWGASTEYGNTAPCSPGPPYSAATDVTASVSGLTPGVTYHFRLKASNASGANVSADEVFTAAGLATINGEFARINGVEAILRAEINPLHLDTTCQLQYVEDSAFQASGYDEATTRPCAQEELGSGSGDVAVSATLTGLKIDTSYHYRFIASSGAGRSEGADQSFTTFGAHDVDFKVIDREEHPFTQAGGYPYELRTSFVINRYARPAGQPGKPEGVDGNVKDVVTQLPAGLIGDPSATAKCTRRQLIERECPAAAQVGLAIVGLEGDDPGVHEVTAVYNLVAPRGVAAEFGTTFKSITDVYIDARLRSDGNYSVTAESSNNTALSGVAEFTLKLWGIPGAESHDNQRCFQPSAVGSEEWECAEPHQAGIPAKPLLRNPTSCSGPLTVALSLDSWQDPGLFDEHVRGLEEMNDCEKVPFTPSLEVKPTTTEADAPTGLHVDLHIPYNEALNGLSQSDLRDTTVTLPPGLTTNAAAASGLQACSTAQIGLTSSVGASPVLFSDAAAQCSDASKIGTVEVDTPLLSEEEEVGDEHRAKEEGGHRVPHVLHGAVYIATPYQNPFGSLLAIYIAISDEQTGIVVKLAGEVQANAQTGQLTTVFRDSPQVPFEDFKLDFFDGPRAALASPEACGAYTPTAALTPWSGGGPTSEAINPPISSFPISSSCVSGFSPTFSAGSESTQAGAFTRFTLSFARSDTDQEMSGLSVTLPPGLIAKVAGVQRCTDAQLAAAAAKAGVKEAAHASCPEDSRVGSVRVGSGAGKNPLFLGGKAYLTGPYNGAPYGLAVVVPAVAGPYDLGTVVVRSALRIDPHTAQVTAVSDPFPTILKGIPIRLRRVDVMIDRPEFTLNPTDCTPMAFTGAFSSIVGASSPLSQRFQVGGCGALRFKPDLKASTSGHTSKVNGASLSVKVAQSPGEADIRKVEVALPLVLPSRLTTLQKACTEAQFNANPAGCPEGSNVGSALAHTPLLNVPLTGPAYLVSHGNAAFPDLEFVLSGEGVQIILDGKTDIKKGITYSRFEAVPDAPISSFETTLPEGPHSVLTANANLCAQTKTVTVRKRFSKRLHGKLRHIRRSIRQQVDTPLLMPTRITAQDGAVVTHRIAIAVRGCPRHKSLHRRTAKHRHRTRRHTRH
jgi:DNA-binding beta-propeller fold protein YncE